jgi:levansucrase
MTSRWTAAAAGTADPARAATVPLIGKIDRQGLAADRLYWDLWPIQDQQGRIARLAGRELWMVLTAPDRGDPALRHFEAKIHLLERAGGRWQDLGPVLPDQVVPYEREWAGSAISDGTNVTLYFTAAGIAARPGGYQQQLYQASAAIGADGLPGGWSQPRPSLNGHHPAYMMADAHEGEAGKIKAFRDPAWFRDPADGAEYLIFTASLAGAASDHNGAVGIARKVGEGWELLPPLVQADGVNNELERAHVLFHAGRYHVFWATQSSTFAPGLGHAPGGLYGMVADRLFGPYEPLNGSGLVLCNPPAEPVQSYSWIVTAELIVASFVDFFGLSGQPVPADAASARRHFGGVPAPLLRLSLLGRSAGLMQVELA